MYHYLPLNFNTPRYISIHRLMSPTHDVSLFTPYCHNPTKYFYVTLTVNTILRNTIYPYGHKPKKYYYLHLNFKIPRSITIYTLRSTPNNVSLFNA